MNLAHIASILLKVGLSIITIPLGIISLGSTKILEIVQKFYEDVVKSLR